MVGVDWVTIFYIVIGPCAVDSLITSVLFVDSISFFYSTLGYIFSLYKLITWLLMFIAAIGFTTAAGAAAGTGVATGTASDNATSVRSFGDGFSSATACLMAASVFLESEAFCRFYSSACSLSRRLYFFLCFRYSVSSKVSSRK